MEGMVTDTCRTIDADSQVFGSPAFVKSRTSYFANRSLCLLALIIMTAILLTGCGRQASSSVAQQTPTKTSVDSEPPIVIVAMGDSLTEGFGVDMEQAYPAQLERRLLDEGFNISVINAGSSGETSSGALSRVDWVLNLKPDIVILATGGNDGLRGIEPSITQASLEQLTERFQDAGVVVVLAGMEMVQNMGEEYTSAFRALYPEVADSKGLIFVPFFLDGVAADPNLNQVDFIHPTAEGYAVVVETLYPYVVEAISSLQSPP
jgi:acyl-CoA thioesterase-1